jgi:N-ethylmaleimide reductase
MSIPSETLLFSPYKLGRITLRNRVVMAPMTRSRALGNVPQPIMATYYAQRAEAGLIITEGTSPSPDGLGYPRIPGLFDAAQIEGWKVVTKAVHAKGGHIFAQLMHTGRVTAKANLPAGARAVAPSAVQLAGQMYTDSAGLVAHDLPHALSDAEVEGVIGEYVQAAKNAIEAGFDGVEIHGANGYLIEQFLNTASNQRTDKWGGSVENRARFALEIARRTTEAIGADRVGIRLSPYGVFNGMATDPQTDALYLHLAKELSALGLVYLHVVDHSGAGAPKPKPELVRGLRETFRQTFILSGGYDAQRATHDLAERKGDLVAFGSKFISNPTLVTKLKTGAPMAPPDQATFYTPGEKGYTDYP